MAVADSQWPVITDLPPKYTRLEVTPEFSYLTEIQGKSPLVKNDMLVIVHCQVNRHLWS